jgi:hypothetical protein
MSHGARRPPHSARSSRHDGSRQPSQQAWCAQLGIRSLRTAGDRRDAPFGQGRGHIDGHVGAVPAGRAGTHDRHRVHAAEPKIATAAHPQQQRPRVTEVVELCRPLGIAGHDDPQPAVPPRRQPRRTRISPSRSRHRCTARCSMASSASRASNASPSGSAPVTSASTSAAVRVRSAAPSTGSPCWARSSAPPAPAAHYRHSSRPPPATTLLDRPGNPLIRDSGCGQLANEKWDVDNTDGRSACLTLACASVTCALR